MSYPRVSAIIATYNRDAPLCSAISCVLSQDYPSNVELIVVDQSESHSDEVNAFLHNHQQRIRHLRQSEPNLPKARNSGLGVATGELILFVDDDVLMPRDALTRLAAHHTTSEALAVSGLVVSEHRAQSCLGHGSAQYRVITRESCTSLVEVRNSLDGLMFML